MSDRLVAWLRTVVPVAWSALVAWLISLGTPPYLTDALGGAAELLVVPILVGVVYPLARSVEARLPDWLTRVLLGSAKPPTYPDTRPPSE
ncbi:hypothetical protein [Saccharothrix deserti]|uniref:hypothetical protein n=1 Tax=Saccharothrix deserti TaxID=2593674 RepID=UPI00131DEA86|nr:hypothetical protein [Saccharothrix deserti]